MRAAISGAVVALCLLAVASASAADPSDSYWSPAWSPDGARIVLVSRGDEGSALLVVNADGSGLRTLLRAAGPNGDVDEPDWSPDGAWIAFDDERVTRGISVVHPDGTGRRRLARGYAPDWSPRARKVAFSCCAGDDAVYAVGRGGGLARLAARADGVAYRHPTWSADGERLAFQLEDPAEVGEYTPHWLGVIGRFGGPVTKLRTGSHHPQQPDWSPAGGRIVFVDAETCICALDLRTHRVRTLLAAIDAWSPRYSPDGRRIVFGRSGTIWTMNADGSGRRRLLP